MSTNDCHYEEKKMGCQRMRFQIVFKLSELMKTALVSIDKTDNLIYCY